MPSHAVGCLDPRPDRKNRSDLSQSSLCGGDDHRRLSRSHRRADHRLSGGRRDLEQRVKVEWLVGRLDAARGRHTGLADEAQEVVIGMGLEQDGRFLVEREESVWHARRLRDVVACVRNEGLVPATHRSSARQEGVAVV